VVAVYEWDDDDQALLDYIAEYKNTSYAQDHYVDRSGPAPELKWQRYNFTYDPIGGNYTYQPSGNWGSLELVIGDWIQAAQYLVDWGPAVWDKPYYFKCDEAGRAFSIDDLVVPPSS